MAGYVLFYVLLLLIAIAEVYHIVFPEGISRDVNSRSSSSLSFGEVINVSSFENDMIEIAKTLKAKKQSIYDLRVPSSEADKYVFIFTQYGHSSIVVVDKKDFNDVYFPPTFGHKIDRPKWPESAKSDSTGRPLYQYHVCLDDRRENYILQKDTIYMKEFSRSQSFLVAETSLEHDDLELHSLLVVPKHYKLILADCLEFAKSFAREIAIQENGIRKTDVDMIFRAITVLGSENVTSGVLEGTSRRNTLSGHSTAFLYFTTLRPWYLLAAIFGLVLLVHLKNVL